MDAAAVLSPDAAGTLLNEAGFAEAALHTATEGGRQPVGGSPDVHAGQLRLVGAGGVRAARQVGRVARAVHSWGREAVHSTEVNWEVRGG